MANGDNQSLRIDASPTKEFFIFMLTRDVQLTRSIIDLVDNCVDGANRLRGEAESFAGLWVRIEIDGKSFRISDNCGGIPIQIARDYAFRFGRPKKARETPHSMGLFGVGMKRTFFKLGEYFSVESRCRTEAFTLRVDVNDWLADTEAEHPDAWHFVFDSVDENAEPVDDEGTGTAIEVSALHPSVADSFRLENFRQQLAVELADAHAASIERGLAITINQIPINFMPQKLFISENLQPAYAEFEYARTTLDGKDGAPVRVKLYAGIAARDYHEGGWYIFCNGRLVLKADKTPTTIWGPTHNMRQYHADFAYFRGYAYFDSQHATLLPWTTTKTGVDTDSVLYKVVQREMIELSKPIIGFLIDLAKERSAEAEDDVLEKSISATKAVEVQAITSAASFRAPTPPPRPKGPPMQWIRYRRPLSLVDKAQRLLHVSTVMEVGERTFDYYLKYEGDE